MRGPERQARGAVGARQGGGSERQGSKQQGGERWAQQGGGSEQQGGDAAAHQGGGAEQQDRGALKVGGVNKAAIGAALGKDKVEAQSNKAASGGSSKEEGQINKAVYVSSCMRTAHKRHILAVRTYTKKFGEALLSWFDEDRVCAAEISDT